MEGVEEATCFPLGSFSVSISGCLLFISRFSVICLVCFSSSPAFFWVFVPVCLSWSFTSMSWIQERGGRY